MSTDIQTAGEAFSSVDLVCQCLIDEAKAHAFEAAVKKKIKPTFHVLDIGTGSGILALLAARAGAGKVTALEFDPYIADVARNNIASNGFSHAVTVLTADARTVPFPSGTHFDMVIMEMLTTGMVDEFQVQAINNLHAQGVIDSSTVLIPQVQETYATIAETDFMNYGLHMKMVRHLWSHDRNDGLVRELSEPVLLNAIDFSAPVSEIFSATKDFRITAAGRANSIYLTSKTLVDEEYSLGSTHSLNASVAVPLATERVVTEGDSLSLAIRYRFGYGYGQFEITQS